MNKSKIRIIYSKFKYRLSKYRKIPLYWTTYSKDTINELLKLINSKADYY